MPRGKAAKSLELVAAARSILSEIQPASVRAVCYKLFVAGLIKDMGKSSTTTVSRHLVYARERGIIPWEWIVDETREPECVPQWSNLSDYADHVRKGYTRDRWESQPSRVEIWSEKGTVRGTVAPVLGMSGVVFRVMHGFGSATVVNQIAGDSIYYDKPFTALYVGDWDPSGLRMSEVDLPERIQRYGGSVEIVRVALEQADLSKLPHFEAETKRGDARHKWYVQHAGLGY